MPTDWKIAIIATSHALMGDSGKPTGVWLEEITTPYYAFVDAGAEVDVYSIAGGAVPIDPNSIKPKGENEDSVERYLADEAAQQALGRTLPASDVAIEVYDAVFLPGGHGTMWDYPQSAALSALIGQALGGGKVVGAVCHGPAGLVSATLPDGVSVVAGKRVTGFSDSEEQAVGLTDVVPFLLETKLRALGADYQSAPDFQPFAVRDGLLVTGQNPASAGPAAEQVIEALKEYGS